MMLVPLAGFVAGMSHVVTGPDHLAAVAPLAVHDRRAAWRAGLQWAMGHAGGVGLIAIVALVLRNAIPLEAHWLSGWSERLVGVMLVGIGLWGIRQAFNRRLHTHVHEHEGQQHVHVHLYPAAERHAPALATAHQHSHAALGVGTLHGLAGGSHFLGVLPALQLGTTEALVYLVAYALGTVASMVAFALALGWVAARAERSSAQPLRGLMAGASLASIAVGVYWLFTSFQAPVA